MRLNTMPGQATVRNISQLTVDHPAPLERVGERRASSPRRFDNHFENTESKFWNDPLRSLSALLGASPTSAVKVRERLTVVPDFPRAITVVSPARTKAH